MNVVASIQVRMGSTRLPGKVMLNILDKPVLRHLYDRVSNAKTISTVVINTSTSNKDDVIEDYCIKHNMDYHRGSEDNVLSRIIGTMDMFNADVGVTLFGDCPVVDPSIIDQFVSFYLKNSNIYDFVGNDLKTTYPPGLEVEVYSVASLKDAQKRLRDPSIKEHGTLFIRKNPDIYRLYNIEAPEELYFPDMEIELDDEKDFQVIKAIFEHFYKINKPDFNAHDVVEFLNKNKHLQQINRDVKRLWKEHRNEFTP